MVSSQMANEQPT